VLKLQVCFILPKFYFNSKCKFFTTWQVYDIKPKKAIFWWMYL